MRTCRLRILMALAVASSFWACSRPQSQNSQLSISVPSEISGASRKLSSQALNSTDKLRHLVISITGEGLSVPRDLIWDYCRHCTDPVIPTTFSLDVPMGNNRLIQVLAVYSNEVTNSMSFYYGDVTANLNSPTPDPIAVPIVSLASGGSIVQGRVSGRLYTSSTTGPSGLVNVRFSPGGGKPKMVVDRVSIIEGWFSFFMLTGVPLEFELSSSREILFGGPVSLDSPIFDPNSSAQNYLKVARAAMPAHIEMRWMNGSLQPENAEAQIYVWGFWGVETGTAGKLVCQDFSTPFSRVKNINGTASLSISQWTSGFPATGIPSTATLLNPSVSTPMTVYGGGTPSACSTAGFPSLNAYSDWLAAKTDFLDANGNDAAAGFQAPFRLLPHGQYLNINPASNPRVVAGRVLPGVQDAFDEFRIFKRVHPQEFQLDSVPCHDVATGAMNFVAAGSGPIDAIGKFSLSTDITSAEASSGVTAVLCLSKNGVMAPQGAFVGKWAFNDPTYPASADSFSLNLAWNKVSPNQCHSGEIRLLSSISSNVQSSTALSFNLSVGGLSSASASFFDDSDLTCSMPLPGSVLNLAATENRKNFRFKISTGTGSNGTVQAQTTSFGNMNRTAGFTYGTSGTLSKLGSLQTGFLLAPGECRAVDIFQLDSADYPVASTAADSTAMSVTPAGSVGVYSDSHCTLATSALNWSIGEFSKRIFVKRLTGSGESSLFLDHSTAQDLTVLMDPAPLADHVQLSSPFGLSSSAIYASNDCVPLSLKALNASNASPPSTPGELMPFEVSAVSGLFFSSRTACESVSGGTPNFQITIGPSFWESSIFFYRPPLGGGSIDLNVVKSSYRISNPTLNMKYTNTFLPIDLTAGPLSSVYGLFQLNSFYGDAPGTYLSNWLANSGNPMSGLTAGGTQPSLGNSGPWKSLSFSTGASLSATGLALGDWTIATRVRFSTAPTAEEGVFQFYSTNCNGGTTSTACALKRKADGSLLFFGSVTSAGLLTDANFHTVVAARGGSTLKLYVDGTLVMTTTASGAQLDSFTSLKIGYTKHDGATNEWFSGNFGDILVYSADVTTGAGLNSLNTYLTSKYP